MEDATGEEPVVDRFRQVYEELYNSWETSGEMEDLKREVLVRSLVMELKRHGRLQVLKSRKLQ